MTTFNLSAVISKINEKKAFLSNAVSSVAKQAAVIANTQEKLASLTMAQNIDGTIVDMASMVEDIFTREDKTITASDRVVFAFFNVSLKNTAKVLPLVRIEELLEAKKTRLDRDAELATQYNAELVEQKNLLSTINANRTKAESELSAILESLPDNVADMLHNAASAVCSVYGQTLSLERDDILKRVESSFFKFKRKEGKRVGINADLDGLKALSNLASSMRKLETANSGMGLEQRAALFESFNTLNDGTEKEGGLHMFNAGELPDVTSAPVQAPKGFNQEAAHAVPNEPVFKPLASYFSSIEGSLVVNSVDGIDVINNLLKSANESRGYSMLKAVKEYRKNPQAALIETIDKFDILLQGYLNVALQEFVESGTHSKLDRLFSSPTMVNSGMLTPYGRQVKAYLACVMPYLVLKHKGEGDSKAYFFEAVKSARFEKLGIADKVGLYAFGVRSKTEKEGQTIDARLPAMCIRSHYRIAKALRDIKRADDARIKEEHAKEWSEYRAKYGEEYTRHTLQAEIDALKAALASKSLELANHG